MEIEFKITKDNILAIKQARPWAFSTARAVVTPPRPPTFPADMIERSVPEQAEAGDNVGAPVTATDVDGDPLHYTLSGGSGAFEIDEFTGQITVTGNVTLDTANAYTVTVTADDENGGRDDIDVTITVTAKPVRPPIIIITGGGGGGGGPSGPSPSEVDFEWTVKHDIEELDGGHDTPSGLWSDGTDALDRLENGDGAADAIYAYDLKSGERVEEREFELDERNRAPRGVWSDRTTIWVSDSGRNRLFAHDLASGERQEDARTRTRWPQRRRPRPLVRRRDHVGPRQRQERPLRLPPGKRRAARRVRPRPLQRRPPRHLVGPRERLGLRPRREAPLRLPPA